MTSSGSGSRKHLHLGQGAGLASMAGTVLCVAAVWVGGCQPASGPDLLSGDWDYFRMLGGETTGGFEARRRFGFAHFEGADPGGSWLHRRAGGDLEVIRAMTVEGDSLFLDFASGRSVRAVIGGDTIAGKIFQDGGAIQRMWFVRRDSPPVYEPYFPLWPGPVSESTYAVDDRPGRADEARDGTTLMSFVARPVGDGPFGVVMERTPYLRIDTANGVFWASRGLHLREAGRARPRRLRRRAGHERHAGAGRLRRRRVGGRRSRAATGRSA